MCCACTCVRACIHMCVHVCMDVYARMCVRTYVRVHVCMHVHTWLLRPPPRLYGNFPGLFLWDFSPIPRERPLPGRRIPGLRMSSHTQGTSALLRNDPQAPSHARGQGTGTEVPRGAHTGISTEGACSGKGDTSYFLAGCGFCFRSHSVLHTIWGVEAGSSENNFSSNDFRSSDLSNGFPCAPNINTVAVSFS